MKLSNECKKEIAMRAMNEFGIRQKQTNLMINSFQKLLLNESEQFLHDINYIIFSKNDIVFTQKMLRFITMIFVYLYKNSKDYKIGNNLEKLFIKIFDILFIKRCDYAKKAETRGDTAQKILLHTSKRLSETLETQELMIANISHEMRTSLNAIYGYLTVIQDKDTLMGEEKHFLKKANQATVTLKALVSDILNVTKINSGQLEMQKEQFWLDEMLLKCIDTVAIDLKGKSNILLETDVDFIPSKVFGYHTHIMEIIINLLSNAIKYTDEGIIKLSMKVLGYRNSKYSLLFSIQDSGIGMTPNELEQIFSPYSRFKTEKQGLGLGLYIAKELSKKMDGEISVTSSYGQGSTFNLTLEIQESFSGNFNTDNKSFCFLVDKNESNTFKQKVEFFRSSGADVSIFKEESDFINYLLTLKEKAPDVVSVRTGYEGYTKNDAFIYYLKTLRLYKNTQFIAEETMYHISLNYFDEIYEFFAPISAYIKKPAKHRLQQRKHTKTISILTVDDIETNQEILKIFIHKKYPNAIIDMANGGYEAIGMFKVKKYDLILLDLKMPGMNGFDVIEKFKMVDKLPPIYAFTADIYKSNYEKIFELGFNGIIEKPLQPQRLYNIIQDAIDEKDN